jgi:hypothetical protein
MRGATVIDVGGAQLGRARAALARAVASGALGSGYAVRRDGDDGFVFTGARSRGPDGGSIHVAPDGRATWMLRLRGAESARATQAVAVAAMVSVVGAILFSWYFFVALPVGGGVGAVYAAVAIWGDRASARRAVGALLSSLPVLLGDEG